MQEIHIYWGEVAFGILCLWGFNKWAFSIDKKLELLIQRLDTVIREKDRLEERIRDLERDNHERKP